MLLGARGPIEAGSWVPIIFTFERGDAFQADLRVESLEESEHDDHR
jgi:copper(I)-binding protein